MCYHFRFKLESCEARDCNEVSYDISTTQTKLKTIAAQNNIVNILLVWEEVGTARMGKNFAPTKEPVVSVYTLYTYM